MSTTKGKRQTIFYLIDGARPDAVELLLRQGKLPNIKKYLVEPGEHRTGVSCFPSTTGPAYLPYLTGCFPGTLNIPGIRWFDKAEFMRKRLNKFAMRSYCGPEAKWFDDDMPDEHPSLHELFGRPFNLFSMITKGVPPEHDLTRKIKSALYTKAHFLHMWDPVEEASHEYLMKGLDLNPDFIFAVFPGVDSYSHLHTPFHPRVQQAYQWADYSVGQLAKKLMKEGRWDDTLIVLGSDHGLTATHTHFDLAFFLHRRGIKTLQYPTIWTRNPKAAVMISGNAFGSVHLMPNDSPAVLTGKQVPDALGAVWNELLHQNAVDFTARRGGANDYIIENKDGRARIAQSGGKLSYLPETADPFGLGELKNLGKQESLEATFASNYPDALVQIAQLFGCRRAGDFVVSARNGYDLRKTYEWPEHYGSHGSLHKEHLLVPLICNKKGWAQRATRTTDIFNTILKWMGKPVLGNTDGESLL